MGYGKIGTDGYLMSSQVQHDKSWITLSSFVKDKNGNFFEYYSEPSVPNMPTSIKYIADISRPLANTGYLVDGSKVVEFGNGGYELNVDYWMAQDVNNIPEPAYTEAEIATYQLEQIEINSVELISSTIQAEIDTYNVANGIALASVHNAESYSRVVGYTHQVFCEAVWLWSVALWEHMRAWQASLAGIPNIEEVQAKIDELPFIMV